jgi:hypothetical protein
MTTCHYCPRQIDVKDGQFVFVLDQEKNEAGFRTGQCKPICPHCARVRRVRRKVEGTSWEKGYKGIPASEIDND